MFIKSLIRNLHVKVTAETSLEKIWKLMARRDITLLPVVDKKQKLVGVIGEDDILRKLVPDYREYFSEFFPEVPGDDEIEDRLAKEIELKAADVVNSKCVTIAPDQPIFKALSKMMSHRFRVLPVVDENGKYLGLIWEDDIMAYLFKHHEHVVRKKVGRV